MKTDKRQIIEIVGIFGVIASLIFVGMQLMLDRRIAAASQYQARAELRVQRLLGQLDSPDFIQDRANRWEEEKPAWWSMEVEQAWVQRNEPMDNLVRLVIDWEIFMVVIDNNYHQYSQGLLDESTWRNSRQSLENALNDPIRRAMYSTASFSSLRAVVNEILGGTEEN